MKNLPLENLAFQLLKQNGFKVSKQYLQKLIVTHPHFPSLLSVSETFDTLKIPNAVVEVPRENFHEIPFPFMAHLNNAGRQSFKLISSKTIGEASFSGNHLSGVVLVIEKSNELYLSEEHSKFLDKEHRTRRKFLLISLVMLICLAASVLQFPSELLISAALINLAGFIFSLLIQIEKFDGGNELTAQLCGLNRKSDCSKIINSKTIRFPLELDWADLSIIYFTGTLICIWITSLLGIYEWFLPVLLILSLLSIPVTLVSIYYQAHVLKSWCTLCLIIISLLWLQASLMLSTRTLTSIPLNSLLFASMIFLGAICAWFLIKDHLIALKKLKTDNLRLLRFKQNPFVFNSLLKKQHEIATTPFNFDIQLGTHDAAVKMLIVCSPYCKPCAETHKVLDELIEQNASTISMTVRLIGNFKNKEDNSTQAAERILQTICAHHTPNFSLERSRSILNDWFHLMDQKKFNSKYPLDNPGNVEHILDSYYNWAIQSQISFTPSIFINGKLLPKEYSAHELKYLLANKGESPVP
ncbi:MAG TPA: vitamin K epoxide reductase family protein [Chitinophagaceae bacterium]|nr:vitamin K epoxide reductase family protein [Chitinophagaceae bacterium]